MPIQNIPTVFVPRTLPVLPGAPSAPIAVGGGAIDTFHPAPVQPTQQSRQAITPSSSSGGGFFSQLWGSVKSALGGLIDKAANWWSANASPLIDKAKGFVSDFVGGWLNKAASWFSGLLGSVSNKLSQ